MNILNKILVWCNEKWMDIVLALFFAFIAIPTEKLVTQNKDELIKVFIFIFDSAHDFYKNPYFYLLFGIFMLLNIIKKSIKSSFQSKLRIGIADFQFGDDIEVRKSRKILIKKIHTGLENYFKDIEYLYCRDIVENRLQANKLGKKKKLDVLVWGSFILLDKKLTAQLNIEIIENLLKYKLEFPEKFCVISVTQDYDISFFERSAHQLNDVILFLLGLSKYASGEYEIAIDIFTSINPQTHEIELFKGNSYCLLDEPKYVEAEEAYRKALISVPEYEEALINLAKVLSATGRIKEAAELWEKTLQFQNPQPLSIIKRRFRPLEKIKFWIWIEVFIYSRLAYEFKKKENYTTAIKYYSKAVQFDWNNGDLWYELAECFSRINQYYKAIESANRVITLGSGCRDAALHLITTCYRKQNIHQC